MSDKNLESSNTEELSLASKIDKLTELVNSEKTKREKTNRIKLIVSIWAFILLFIYGILFVNLYKYYKSEAFLENVKYKAVEITPYVSKELSNAAEKSRPLIFEQLTKSFESYLPVLSEKLNEEYQKTLDKAVENTKVAVNDLVASQVDEVLKRANVKLEDIQPMSQEQFEEVKNGMIKDLTKTADKLLTEGMQDQLFQCTTWVKNLQDTVLEIKNIPEKERKKAAFEVMKGILEAVEQKELSK